MAPSAEDVVAIRTDGAGAPRKRLPKGAHHVPKALVPRLALVAATRAEGQRRWGRVGRVLSAEAMMAIARAALRRLIRRAGADDRAGCRGTVPAGVEEAPRWDRWLVLFGGGVRRVAGWRWRAAGGRARALG